MSTEQRRIVLTGGGTLGPVTPLLAVVEYARAHNLKHDFFWIGTSEGPEEKLIQLYDIPFFVVTSGKLRRYFDVRTMLLPLQLLQGFWQGWLLLKKIKPDVVVSVGAYVSVPVAYAAWCRGVPVLLHEMDVERGLANKLIGPVARLRTSVWSRAGAKRIGSLVRHSVKSQGKREARAKLGIPDEAEVVLVTGGGTGAGAINTLIWASLELLPSVWFIHVTGTGKENIQQSRERYIQVPFAEKNMIDFLAAADVVVTRAGIGTLSELAVLQKIALIIPMPQTHQEANASYLLKNNAAYVCDQRDLTPSIFSDMLKNIFSNPDMSLAKAKALQQLIPDGTAAFVELLQNI